MKKLILTLTALAMLTTLASCEKRTTDTTVSDPHLTTTTAVAEITSPSPTSTPTTATTAKTTTETTATTTRSVTTPPLTTKPLTEVIPIAAKTTPPVTPITLTPVATEIQLTSTKPTDAQGIDYYGDYYKIENGQLYTWLDIPFFEGWVLSKNSSTTYTLFPLWQTAFRNEYGSFKYVTLLDGSVDLSQLRTSDGTVISYDEYIVLQTNHKDNWSGNNPELATYDEMYSGNYKLSRDRLTGDIIIESPNGKITPCEFDRLCVIFGIEVIDWANW